MNLVRDTVLVVLVAVAALPDAAAGTVEFTRLPGRVAVSIDGAPFTEYRFDTRRPCFFPIRGPSGRMMTRLWPLDPDSGLPESRDHPHHTGAWFAHGEVRAEGDETPADFWHHETMEVAGTIELDASAEGGRLVCRKNWLRSDGSPLCTDRTVVRFGAGAGVRWIDYEILIEAPEDRSITLGDTKEGTFGIRVPETMAIETVDEKLRHLSAGKIHTSAGHSGRDAWGKRAAWCAYSGPVEGRPAAIVIFDHPSNPRHPTWWMARHYGLFAANPFGRSFFEDAPAGSGDFTIPAGESVRFRYRMVFLDADFERDRVQALYEEFSSPDS